MPFALNDDAAMHRPPAMNFFRRSTLVAATMLLTVVTVAPRGAWAQTPAQMEYERQQRGVLEAAGAATPGAATAAAADE
jgi:hypothetical protein